MKQLLIALLSALLLASCHDDRKIVIGVSQCSTDSWRAKLNAELRMGAYFYDNVEVKIMSANDNAAQQESQIRQLVAGGIDLLVVSPAQTSVQPAIDEAFDRGIPVIMVDRKTRSAKYSAFVGADNRQLGHMAASYIAAKTGRRGRVAELCGLGGSSAAEERQEGFDDEARLTGGISVTAAGNGWTEHDGYRAMDSLLATGARFDAVFAHNDRIAAGAVRALARHHATATVVGIDALPGKDGGIQMVEEGKLAATLVYPTRGDSIMAIAMNILQRRHYQRENILPSAIVNKDNAHVLLLQYQESLRQAESLSELHAKASSTLRLLNNQYSVLVALVVVIVMLVVVCAVAYKAYLVKADYSARLGESYDKQQKLTREMSDMTRAQLQFFTNISHELRTPLTLIAGPVGQLCADPSLHGRQHSLLLMISRNVDMLIQLVNEILEFRKMHSGKIRISPTRFDIAAATRKWMANFEEAARQKHVTLRCDMPGGGLTITADETMMGHVFFNLLSNAMKFTPPGGTITASASAVERGGRTWTRLAVADTGKGIDAAETPHIFERFYQAKGTSGGTGIGLALVNDYVTMHHGTVSAGPNHPKGTVFTIMLPAAPEPAGTPALNPAGTPATAAVAAASTSATATAGADDITSPDDDMQKPRILVVDDNADMRAYLRGILAGRFHVEEAADGNEGLARARRNVPELVVSDVMMPGMDGLEMCRRLKSDTATCHIPVVLLTARTFDGQRTEGYNCGADSYITKPFDDAMLTARVDNLLANRQRLREVFASAGHEDANEDKVYEGRDKAFIRQLRAIVQRDLADSSLNVERIGAEVGLSRVQLYRKVKALTGLSPVELVRKARLERARRMLAAAGHTVSEVAYAVGFSSPSYFTKCYKEEYGTSPTGSTADKQKG